MNADVLQAFMAASMVHDYKGGWKFCVAKPGQGKTIVMILVALWIEKHHDLKPVIIG